MLICSPPLPGFCRAAAHCASERGPLPFSKAQRILVVSKTTRYENELAQLTSSHGSSQATVLMRDAARRQGSDLKWLSRTHQKHEAFVGALVRGLKRLPWSAEVRVVKCYGGLQRKDIDDADFIFSMGGDGTFLRTASLIQNCGTAPLLCGVNTDPSRSEGFLCVNHGSQSSDACTMRRPKTVEEFLKRLSSDDVQYITRQRIRVTVTPASEDIDASRGEGGSSGSGDNGRRCCGTSREGHRLLALNDVLVAEHEAQKTSYYELRFTCMSDRSCAGQVTVEKQKSSGLLICTGTGSTAWSRAVTGVQPSMVKRILDLVGRDDSLDPTLPQRIAEEINRSQQFAPGVRNMRFVVREPIINGVFTCDHTTGFAQHVAVRPRSAGLRIFADGQLMAPLPLGHLSTFSMHEEDALRAVHVV